MRFHIITIFPSIFDPYFNESILKRAQKNNLIKIKIYNLRRWTKDKHKTVDDAPYGGGAGMVMKIEPIYQALRNITAPLPVRPRLLCFAMRSGQVSGGIKGVGGDLALLQSGGKGGYSPFNKGGKGDLKSKTILLSAKGKTWNQQLAKKYSKLDNIILICGRYEGVDERVKKFVDEEISIGDYVLTGGEIAAMAIVDSITRLLPGALGNSQSAKDESHSQPGILEYPQYTRPAVFIARGKKYKVPKILLSGNHQKIEEWRKKKSKFIN